MPARAIFRPPLYLPSSPFCRHARRDALPARRSMPPFRADAAAHCRRRRRFAAAMFAFTARRCRERHAAPMPISRHAPRYCRDEFVERRERRALLLRAAARRDALMRIALMRRA